MSEIDRVRRARERGDSRTWRERALDAEQRLAKAEALAETLRVISKDGDDWAGSVASKAIAQWDADSG